jgi:orotate phosphoribosyltransferase-like protein
MDSKKDPEIAAKATELRSQGLSWSQIASRLGIGRTTARRLVTVCLNKKSVEVDKEIYSSMPKSNHFDSNKSDRSNLISSLDDDIFGKLPKSFQIFSELLEKAKDAQRRKGG